MGLADGDVVSGPGFPVLDESGVDVLVKLTRGIVGDIEQRHGRASPDRKSSPGERDSERE
jgi:hypothetical protein